MCRRTWYSFLPDVPSRSAEFQQVSRFRFVTDSVSPAPPRPPAYRPSRWTSRARVRRQTGAVLLRFPRTLRIPPIVSYEESCARVKVGARFLKQCLSLPSMGWLSQESAAWKKGCLRSTGRPSAPPRQIQSPRCRPVASCVVRAGEEGEAERMMMVMQQVGPTEVVVAVVVPTSSLRLNEMQNLRPPDPADRPTSRIRTGQAIHLPSRRGCAR